MDAGDRGSSNQQSVRLLQLGSVPEEATGTRASQQSPPPTSEAGGEPALEELLTEARGESAEALEQGGVLIDRVAETVTTDHVEQLIRGWHGKTKPEDSDDVLSDQFHAEESADGFSDDLVAAIQENEADLEVDRETLLTPLDGSRQERAEDVQEVIAPMENQP